MRKLIKRILSESFINEKAAPRRRHVVEPKVEPEEDYSKTGMIHSMNVNDDGKVTIVWKDDLRKVEKKYEEIRKLEDSIKTLDNHLRNAARGSAPPGYFIQMTKMLSSQKEQLQKLKDEVESESIDKPMINYFNI